MAPAVMASIAASSPMVPEKKRNGTSGQRPLARSNAEWPSYEGSVKSEIIRSNPPRFRADSNSWQVSTRTISQAIPSSASIARTSSASFMLSSRWSMRIGDFPDVRLGLLHSSYASRRRLVDDRPEGPELFDGIDE